MADVSVHQGDLTAWDVDAIVNAANNDLALGSGLAGAIARRGGPSIQAECNAHGPIEVGQAAITGAGDLPARFIIHQASMGIGKRVTEQSLRSSTAAALELAEGKGLTSIAFPATGTGVGGFNMRRCAEIMIAEAKRFLATAKNVRDVHFVLFDEDARDVFQQVADTVFD
ncbi:MAG: macro domain-containing protein [Planctomycetota bacterium]|jgi:O-acetyl-ADP-ribose deacetylase (regulator of RNase III)